MGAPEVRICYERAEALCHSLGRPLLLYVPLTGQWRYTLITDKMSAAMQIAERLYSLAKEQDDPALMIGAYRALAALALWHAAVLASYERNPAEVDRWASESVELSTRYNFVYWLAAGAIHRGWARSNPD
jgi:hypothetical protein